VAAAVVLVAAVVGLAAVAVEIAVAAFLPSETAIAVSVTIEGGLALLFAKERLH